MTGPWTFTSPSVYMAINTITMGFGCVWPPFTSKKDVMLTLSPGALQSLVVEKPGALPTPRRFNFQDLERPIPAKVYFGSNFGYGDWQDAGDRLPYSDRIVEGQYQPRVIIPKEIWSVEPLYAKCRPYVGYGETEPTGWLAAWDPPITLTGTPVTLFTTQSVEDPLTLNPGPPPSTTPLPPNTEGPQPTQESIIIASNSASNPDLSDNSDGGGPAPSRDTGAGAVGALNTEQSLPNMDSRPATSNTVAGAPPAQDTSRALPTQVGGPIGQSRGSDGTGFVSSTRLDGEGSMGSSSQAQSKSQQASGSTGTAYGAFGPQKTSATGFAIKTTDGVTYVVDPNPPTIGLQSHTTTSAAAYMTRLNRAWYYLVLTLFLMVP
jgi:hypothetical protein